MQQHTRGQDREAIVASYYYDALGNIIEQVGATNNPYK